MTASRIDPRAARRRFERAAATYGEVAVLAREVERRMADRLDYIRSEPQRVLDAGCGPGEGLRLLHRRYPKAQILGVDSAWSMARAARRSQPLLERAMAMFSGAAWHNVCADLARLPLAAASVGMVWSNLALSWAPDAGGALAEFARVLAPQGLLMFSTYGPDTLKELRSAFAQVDGHAHVHQFIDMHDLGDILVGAGFAQPVMDMDRVTLDYADVPALARDLRLSGQTNTDADRRRGLIGRDAWAKLVRAYDAQRRDGRLPATFEIVYGHAWKGAGRSGAGETRIVKMDLPPRRK